MDPEAMGGGELAWKINIIFLLRKTGLNVLTIDEECVRTYKNI